MNKDLIQLTEAYEQILKEGIETKSITDRLRDKAAKSDRDNSGANEQIGQYEYAQAERWITQINADIMIGLRHNPEHVLKNISRLIEQLQSLMVSVQKFNKTKG